MPEPMNDNGTKETIAKIKKVDEFLVKTPAGQILITFIAVLLGVLAANWIMN